MSDLSAAAEALGIPEMLVRRSAEARAAETGASVDEILAAWAGGESGPAAPAAAEPAETTEPEEKPEGAPEPESAPESPQVTIEIPGDEPERGAPAVTVSRAAGPTEVTAAEASNLPVVVTVPTSGIKERTNFAIPKWLATLLFLAPLVALFAVGSSATGECGTATQLATNVITGEIVNCDGSEFTGSAVGGGGGADFIAMGEALYQGGEVSGVNCAACHGAGGGGGAGPALNGVLRVFGSCPDHIEWVALATTGFEAAGRSTYGDSNKPVRGFGLMPGFGSSLSEEQIAAVAAFERVRFGGQEPEATLTDCGLAEGPEGETPAEGEEGTENGKSGENGEEVDQPTDTTAGDGA